MLLQWLLTLSPIIALMINVVSQIISVHLTQRIGMSILIGLLLGLIENTLFCHFLFITDSSLFSIDNWCVSILTYLALSFCYWAFLNLNITSLRIRIARELLLEKNGILTTKILLQRYSPQEFINRRIQRLETTGQIKDQDGKWILLSKKLLLFVIVSTALRKLIIPSNSSRV